MKPEISVVMAVYNGETYIREQLDSILAQLSDTDELILSYNKSKDRTEEILREYERAFKQVRVVECLEKGVQANFENAVRNARGDYIFLSDQDDIWLPEKIEKCKRCFHETGAELIMHNAYIADEAPGSIRDISVFQGRITKKGIVRKMLKSSYHGCCMAFRKSLKEKILPIPRGPFFHDVWIGMTAEIFKRKVYFYYEKLMIYRRHGDNNSIEGGRTIGIKLRERIMLLGWLILRRVGLKYKMEV